MVGTITIVDRGRGPQLANCRITVQDLFPYLQGNYSYDEIMAIMPVLRPDDIRAVERYIADHRDEVVELDRRIRERAAQRRQSAEVEESIRSERRQRLEAARKMIQQERERNGDQAAR